MGCRLHPERAHPIYEHHGSLFMLTFARYQIKDAMWKHMLTFLEPDLHVQYHASTEQSEYSFQTKYRLMMCGDIEF